MKYVRFFREIHKDDVKIAGGKGANLGEMYNAGFPVPPGFVVTANAYKDFIEKTGIINEMKEILEKINYDDYDSIAKASKEIQALILSEEIPFEIRAEIKSAYESMYKISFDLPKKASEYINAIRTPPFVAVRSSATAEDLPQASFAGQQATYLNVKGEDELINAVQKCWASLFTTRAIFYRHKNNFDHFKVLIAVVVQKMVNSEASGVAFTVDPVSEDPNLMVIEAAFGLGEAVVGGQVTPDHYVVDKRTFEIVEKKIAHKDFMIIRDPSGKNKKVYLDEDMAEKQVLSDDKIIELAKILKKIEDHYRKPQDIEWAKEGMKLYIVQSRPITTLGKKFEKPNYKEHLGEPILKGLPASKGIAHGPVKIVMSADEIDKVKKGDILVTKMTDPDFVPAMRIAAAIITDEGGMTSHAAIVSREMGIPCIVGTGNATQVLKEGEMVTVDAVDGYVYRGVVEIERKEKAEVEEEKIDASKLITKTKIFMNLGVPFKIKDYKDLPFDGIGLMRVEFIIASQIGKHPLYMIEQGRENEYIDTLANGIEEVASAVYPRPVIVRFSDFKSNEYRNLEGGEKYEPMENNPMIGFRGVSRYVSPKFEKAFRLECRAIKKVREKYDNVYVMLPFVRTVEEVIKVLKIMESEGLIRNEKFKVFLMAEVPSIVVLADEFAKLPIDGISIGSNDLTQLTLGVDRDSEILGELGYFDERNEAVLRSINRLIKVFHEHGKTVSICGQAPSVYPEFMEFLIRAGIDDISLNPDAVEDGKIKAWKIEQKLKFERALNYI